MKKCNPLEVFTFLIVLQLFVFVSGVRAEERFVGKHQDGTRYYIIDKKLLEKTVKVWVKKVPNKQSAFYKNYVSFLNLTGAKGDTYSHSIAVYEIDCPKRTIRLLNSTDFDNSGKVLFKTSEDSSAPLMAIPDGSMLDKIKQQVCK